MTLYIYIIIIVIFIKVEQQVTRIKLTQAQTSSLRSDMWYYR